MSSSDFDSGESELSESFSEPEGPEWEEAPAPRAAPELPETPSRKRQKESALRPSKDRSKKLKTGEGLRAIGELEGDVSTLQINEILAEITPSEKQRGALLSWFSELKAILLTAPQDERGHLAKSKIPLPIEGLPEEHVGEFVFRPPKSVRLVGSFAYDVAVKWSALDIAVEMPKECFAKGDYHNSKYHHRRALYLTHLAALLQRSSSLRSLKLEWCVNGDYRLPLLTITSQDGGSVAHVLPFPEEGSFPPSRFAPDKLNIQEKFIGMPEGSRKPVPIYNGGVLQDLLLIATAEALSKQLSASAGVRQGIQLLKLWLRSRGLCEGPDGFTSFLLTIYVSHLLRRGRLNMMMGASQVVRTVLAQLQAEEDAGRGGATTASAGEKSGGKRVLLDESGCHNYFYRLSRHCHRLLSVEARAALHSMNSASVTLINDLFTTRIPFHRKLDCFAKIQLGAGAEKRAGRERDGGPPDGRQQETAKGLDRWLRADFGRSLLWPTAEAVLATLDRAFGRRVSLLASCPLDAVRWAVGDEVPPEPNELDVGWNLEPDENRHHIEKGPPADSREAEEFRAFWGERCEIRRFQDGAILETVVWPADADERKRLSEHICEYALLRHHEVSRVRFAGEVCDRLLELPRCRFPQRYGTGQEQLFDINTKFHEFGRLLRSLKGLPLAVTAVQGLSEEFAYTAVFPATAAACDSDARLVSRIHGRCVPRPDQAVPKLVRPLDVLLVMAASGKWPDELAAARHVKTAFYFALATELVGRQCQVFDDHLLVLFQGLVFRVRVSCPKEVLLLKQVTGPSGLVRLQDSRESEQLEFDSVVLPQLISALHGLHLQQPTFGTTCRLAKRWLSCHMLHDGFPPLAVDLLVASLYLSPLPFSSLPHSARAGFQRFLHVLSTCDWRLNPLVVNVNDGFGRQEDLAQISSHFTRNRPSLPALYIRTPFDRSPKSFITSERPSGLVLHRASRLAGKCLRALEACVAEGQPAAAAAAAIFRTSLTVFDFVIKLDPRSVATAHLALDSQEKLSFTKVRDEIPVVDFDPVAFYVEELRAAFGHLCVLFYDGYGGTDIGGLWIPKAQVPLPFKVRNVNARRLVEPARVLVPNYSAIFADFKTLGQGLVKDVVEQRCPNKFNQRVRKDSR